MSEVLSMRLEQEAPIHRGEQLANNVVQRCLDLGPNKHGHTIFDLTIGGIAYFFEKLPDNSPQILYQIGINPTVHYLRSGESLPGVSYATYETIMNSIESTATPVQEGDVDSLSSYPAAA